LVARPNTEEVHEVLWLTGHRLELEDDLASLVPIQREGSLERNVADSSDGNPEAARR
jgi:hypothetical protein